VNLLAGTSGYSYAPWKGSFYPEKLPAAKMLGFYATRLPTVEINNTFYRMPSKEAVAAWGQEVPAGFRFALKAPRRITHERRLVGAEPALDLLVEAGGALGAQMGPMLFQLPPNFRLDLGRLEGFLAQLRARSSDVMPAFEFRHASWFVPEVYAALEKHRAALCIADSEDLATPVQPTAPWGYLRLRRQDYDDGAVALWAQRIAAQPWEQAFVFFKHEDEGKGPRLAEQLLTQWASNPERPVAGGAGASAAEN
jgi:uncharacterized protein YecE (DUF72 family)